LEELRLRTRLSRPTVPVVLSDGFAASHGVNDRTLRAAVPVVGRLVVFAVDLRVLALLRSLNKG